MSESEFQMETHELSEAELRAMLEEREREKELERAQTSRKFSIILVVGVAVLAAAIFFFPSKPMPVAKAPADKLVLPAQMPNPLNPDPTNSDPALMNDMKPFMIQPGQENLEEEIRFGAQLLNFSHAPTSKSQKAAAPAAAQPKAGPAKNP